jgi:hypothetical protein
MVSAIKRGLPLTLALATTLGLGLVAASSARADGMIPHTIPREVDAYDFTTGGPFMAPPVPNGHYSKDYVGDAHKALACVACQLHALMNGGKGHCLFHQGHEGDEGGGHGHAGGPAGIEFGAGHGVYGPTGAAPYGVVAAGSGIGPASPAVLAVASGGPAGYATTGTQPSGQTGPVAPSAQAICGQPGCAVVAKHSHLSQMLNKVRCGSCGGLGCGACAGTGATGLCGDPGCSLGAGHGHGGGAGCPFCGGQGCSKCVKKGHKFPALGHSPKMQWFLGAGGPVPLTPGYVPYIVTTRSPRDFFSFAPMNPNDR